MKLVIFDCDGTLVDSQHMICAAMQHAYQAHGLVAPARERLLGIVGLSLEEAFLALAGAEQHPIAGLALHYKTAFAALREAGEHGEVLYPGADAAIEALAARPDVFLGMATGKSQRGVRAVLARHGLYDRFQTIQTADDAPSKPHPAMVEQAMRAVGVTAADTVMVGDSTYDMAMAQAAGAAAIGVAWGYHRPDALQEAGAAVVIDTFADLVPSLEALWGAAPHIMAASPPQARPVPSPLAGEG